MKELSLFSSVAIMTKCPLTPIAAKCHSPQFPTMMQRYALFRHTHFEKKKREKEEEDDDDSMYYLQLSQVYVSNLLVLNVFGTFSLHLLLTLLWVSASI
jgi:hypothetical protein